MPNNLQPPLSTAKRSIINFSKSQVSNLDLKAIQLVLSPCCTNSITAVTAICDPDHTGNYIVTINLAEPLSLLGQGLVFISTNSIVGTLNDQSGSPFFPISDGKVITIKNVHFNQSVSGVASVALQILLPINSEGTASIATLLGPFDTTFPTC